MIAVAFVFSHFLAVLAAILGMISLTAPLVGEPELLMPYLIAAFLVGFVAIAMILTIRGHERRLRRIERFGLAAIVWLLLPAFAMLPTLLTLPDIPVTSAYFDAVSALTTTGVSVLPPPEQLPRLLVLWHATLQWFGGLLTLLVVATILAYSGLGGLSESIARQVEHGGEDEWARVIKTFRELVPIYMIASLLTFAALNLSGMPTFESWCFAGAAISTGSLMAASGDVTPILGNAGMWIMTFSMLIGGTSIMWHRALLTWRVRALREHRESYIVLALVVFFGFLIAVLLYRGAGTDFASAIREGAFTASALVTTTGIEARPGLFQVLPPSLVLLIVLVGSASFSTGGGIKIFRVVAMLRQARADLVTLIYPHSVQNMRFGAMEHDMPTMKAIWAHFAITMMMVGLAASMLAGYGLDIDTATMASVAILSNVGEIYPAAIAEGGFGYSMMHPAAQMALAFLMVLGRVEVIVALSLVGFLRLSR